MKTIKLKTSKHNEIDSTQLQTLIDKGIIKKHHLIKSEIPNGKFLHHVVWEKNEKEGWVIADKIYSDDEIIINNVQLGLAEGNNEYFNSFIEINLSLKNKN